MKKEIFTPPTAPAVIRIDQVEQQTQLARSTIYRMMSENLFPRHFKLGVRAVGWLQHEVQEWISERARMINHDEGHKSHNDVDGDVK